ncbi:MAG: LysM peptidoglycan-binding domain-containing protein [Clostridiaceae bacterium]|jgi:serine/threonine protein phosphatase PrpC|nr:LysM peptidoglycan-binding domain-containing protein [Clostridiaceae bacterium]
MSSVIKVNACVYSRIGYGRTNNTNSFYINGKFTSEQHIENVQASMENRGVEYLFAVSDNMVYDYPEQEVSTSILKEVGKFHEKITVNGGDINSKIKELESRVNDTERLITSFLEMNRVPETYPEWNLGFSGLLLSEGQLVAVTSGNGRIFMMRDGRFKPLASDVSRAKREIDNKVLGNEEENDTDIILPGEEEKGSAVVSDVYNIVEGDSFLLLSNGLYETLGEEKIEDILALRSDSTYIAHRLVDEAMKRKTEGDLTALVVQVEKVLNQGKVKRQTSQTQQRIQPKQDVRAKVQRLNKAPAITYKYNRRKTNKYQSSILVGMVFVSVLIMFGIIFFIITSLMNTGKENFKSPTPTPPTTSTTPTGTPDVTPTEDPVETEIPVETPTPTPTPQTGADVREHVVKSGDSLSSITRTYYGDTSLVNALCKYNNITDPNKITQGQVIKIPPKDVLKAQ